MVCCVCLWGDGSGVAKFDMKIGSQGVVSYVDLVYEVMDVWDVGYIRLAQVLVLDGSDTGVVVSLSRDVCSRLNLRLMQNQKLRS